MLRKLNGNSEVDTGDYENSDIGLMISKSLVQANHGTLRAISDVSMTDYKIIFTMRAKMVST